MIYLNRRLDNLEGEVWKNVQGYETSYMVSNKGRVKSYDSRFINKLTKGISVRVGRIIAQEVTCWGYLGVRFSVNYKRKYMLAHRLVAMAFIPNPENKKTVNHINGIKTDNRAENLEWKTLGENIKHAFDTGLKHAKKGELSTSSILTTENVLTIRKLIEEGVPQRDIAKQFKVHFATISAIHKKKNWKHI